MSSQALEQMLENSFVPNIATNRVYQTIDTYIGGTTQLYSFDPPKPKLTIRDFQASGVQLYIHEGPGGTAHWRPYDRTEKIPINSYDAAMADLKLPDYIKKTQK